MKNRNIILTTVLLALGFCALCPTQKAFAVVPPPDGGYPGGNTAEGHLSLGSLTTGLYNTGVGIYSLLSITDGSLCTGVGAGALFANTGDQNTAIGAGALFSNTTATDNTADGAFALFSNTEGQDNTASGSNALFSNTQGSANTANGGGALFSNIIGDSNTATGLQALRDNITGSENTANGTQSLTANTTGNSNTAVGFLALAGNDVGNSNTAIGVGALGNATGSGNIAIGFGAGALVGSSGNVIAIGSPGDDTDNTCFIGNIRDVQTQNADAIAVVVDSAGQLGTTSSSRRFKTEIKPMTSASESILALKPVTFRYKNAEKATPQFGLIAEEVATVNPDLVVRDKKGEIYTVRYDAVNAMLLNEFLKEHRKVKEQGCKIEQQEAAMAQQRKDFEATVTQLKQEVGTLLARSKEQDAKIQKVSAEVEVNRSQGQLVSRDRGD